MTERAEIENMIGMTRDVIDQLTYEANTLPGDGAVFVAQLNLANKKLLEAVSVLEQLLIDTGVAK